MIRPHDKLEEIVEQPTDKMARNYCVLAAGQVHYKHCSQAGQDEKGDFLK